MGYTLARAVIGTRRTSRWFTCTCFLVLSLLFTKSAKGYGVLTHQAVIDAVWDKNLRPLLQHRFPAATEEQLLQAHAYAYGGSIIQDMGYFPFGNTFFTNLTHYVRSGDFVENLIASSNTVDEYAFALGALAHFNADVYGHPIGTNRAAPMVYPKIKQEYGDNVTYADDPASHIKTELGFDILQLAHERYAPEAYKDFIGFEVAPEVLEKAFQKTYGLELKDVFANLHLAIGSYRYSVKTLLPELTKAAWKAKESEIKASKPGITQRKFRQHMSRASYHEQWGNCYERPHFFARAAAYIIKVLPKVGPLKPLSFVPPTPEAEEVFMKSFNTTVENYANILQQMLYDGPKVLPNLQLDTGKPTKAGTYELTDETYMELLVKLDKRKFEYITPALQQNILHFFRDPEALKIEKGDKGEKEKVLKALSELQMLQQ